MKLSRLNWPAEHEPMPPRPTNPRPGRPRHRYAERLAEQGGVCAICRRPESVAGRTLADDHDHATGADRGLLCSRCNMALGLFGDDVELLRSAITYLDTWST